MSTDESAKGKTRVVVRASVTRRRGDTEQHLQGTPTGSCRTSRSTPWPLGDGIPRTATCASPCCLHSHPVETSSPEPSQSLLRKANAPGHIASGMLKALGHHRRVISRHPGLGGPCRRKAALTAAQSSSPPQKAETSST